jgi:hypothetical protein
MVNAPITGFMLTPEGLEEFKKQGGHVVITALEFAKHETYRDPTEGASRALNTFLMLEKADQVVFLDENDKKSAEIYAKKLGKSLPPAQVIAVPPTVPLARKALADRGKDIISFGIIRHSKGLNQVCALARLIKDSKEASVSSNKVLIVGTVSQVQEEKMDPTLRDLMLEVYPDQKEAILAKNKPSELVALLKEIQENKKIVPAIPIELHLNVPANSLPDLFDRCTYSYLPAYRGGTLRNTSISSSIANPLITFVHDSDITPDSLRENGEHSDAIILIPEDAKQSFSHSPRVVLAEIVNREKNPEHNIKTEKAALKLVANSLCPTIVAAQYAKIYSELTQASLHPSPKK